MTCTRTLRYFEYSMSFVTALKLATTGKAAPAQLERILQQNMRQDSACTDNITRVL